MSDACFDACIAGIVFWRLGALAASALDDLEAQVDALVGDVLASLSGGREGATSIGYDEWERAWREDADVLGTVLGVGYGLPRAAHDGGAAAEESHRGARLR